MQEEWKVASIISTVQMKRLTPQSHAMGTNWGAQGWRRQSSHTENKEGSEQKGWMSHSTAENVTNSQPIKDQSKGSTGCKGEPVTKWEQDEGATPRTPSNFSSKNWSLHKSAKHALHTNIFVARWRHFWPSLVEFGYVFCNGALLNYWRVTE